MSQKSDHKEIGNTTRASVLKEMAKPTMARSARITKVTVTADRALFKDEHPVAFVAAKLPKETIAYQRTKP